MSRPTAREVRAFLATVLLGWAALHMMDRAIAGAVQCDAAGTCPRALPESDQ